MGQPSRDSPATLIGAALRSAWPAALAVATCCSLLLWLPLLALNPETREPSQAALLFVYLSVFHGAWLGPLALMTALCLAWSEAGAGSSPGPRRRSFRVAATLIAVVVALNAVLRFTPSYAMFRAGRLALLTPLGVLDLVVFTVTPLVVLCALRPRLSPRFASGLLAAWAAILLLTCALNLAVERPARLPMADLRSAPTAGPAPAASRAPDRVALLGFDGLSWQVIAAMLREGQLPHLERLLQRGARANLRSEVPTLSPVLWNTVATGRPAAGHGVFGFASFRLPGMRATLARGPLWLTMNWWNGANRVLGALASRGWIERTRYRSTQRKAAAVWDVAWHHGLTAGVTRWYSTWPVPDLAPGSYMVADYEDRPRAAFPPGAVAGVVSSTPIPDLPLPSDSPLRSVAGLARDAEEHHRDFYRALALRRRFRPTLSMDYWHFPDGVQHLYWRGDTRSLLIPGERDPAAFARPITEAYRLADSWLGDFLAELEAGTLLLVVSDHGYEFDGHEHHGAPDGVLIAAGPGVRPGTIVREASLYDIAPTILAALGLPVSDELEGRVLQEILAPGAGVEIARVESYDWFRPYAVEAERDPELERQQMEELEALGYVN